MGDRILNLSKQIIIRAYLLLESLNLLWKFFWLNNFFPAIGLRVTLTKCKIQSAREGEEEPKGFLLRVVGFKNLSQKNKRGWRLLGTREYLFTVRLRQCRHFFKLITSTQQLLFRSSHFFRAATFFELLLF